MVRKASVSLCMIVRDEEQNLRECLGPVAHLFDEIVIVDTGSHDNTRQIASEFTSHVYDFPWSDDFAAARNESLRHATGDWVFWLDADDRVRPEHVARLRKLFDEELDDRSRVMLMDTVLAPADPNDDIWFVTHPRLFRRHPELHWHGRVHEQLSPEPHTLGYEWVLTDVQIDHVGYQDRVLFERKARRKLRLLRMDYAVDPDNSSTLLHLGMTLVRMRNMREAREHLLLLASRGQDWLDCMRRVFDSLAEISLYEGKPGEATHFSERGLKYFPDDEHLLFALASALYALEDYAGASRPLERIIQGQGMPHMYFGAVGNVSSRLAPRMLGAVRRMQQQFSEAEEILEAALRDFPADVCTWYNLGLVYLDQGLGIKLAPIVRQLLTLKDGQVEAGLLAALWHLRHGNPALAGPIIDDLIAMHPHLPRPRMLRAECLSRCLAPLDSQIHALRDVLRVQPGNLEAKRWIEEAKRVQSAAARAPAAAWSSSVVMPGAAQVT